ncbi:MAG: glycosyltransferase family 1 protein [Pseudomonadota bacterium]
MSKKLHVCIDGLNLSLKKGTGIATYARNLGNQLHQAGFKVSVLFDKRLNEKAPELLYEATFYEAINKPSEKERNPLYRAVDTTSGKATKPRKSLIHYIRIPFYFFKSIFYFIKPPSAKEHLFPGVVEHTEMKARLPIFDTLYNSWGLYRLAQCYFLIFGRLLPIKLNPTPDIMHWTCPIPARVVGAKNYYTIHDIIPLRLPYTTQDNKKFFHDMLLRIIKAASKLITVSEFSRNDILAYLPVSEDKITNTYQDVSLSDAWTLDREKFSKNQLQTQFGLSAKNYFLFVGAIEPKKNVVRLLEGYLSANVEQKLVVVGPLAWQSEKEQVLLRQHPEKIIYLKYVSNDSLNTLMRNARALVFPSLFEGFGLPVMEAMSVGLPVITSHVSSLPEIAGDAAYLVDPYNVGEIAAAIDRLSKDDALCASLSAKGKERANYFSGDAYSARLKAIYGCLI